MRVAKERRVPIIPWTMSEWKSRLREAAGRGDLLAEAGRNIDMFLAGTGNPVAAPAVRELVEQAAWQELNDRFYQTLEFGTGGLRGRTIGRIVTAAEQGNGGPGGRPEHPCIGTAAMNYFNVGRAMRGFVIYVRKHLGEVGAHRRPGFVLAHDTRHFSREFAAHCAKVCVELGCDAWLFEGPRATPELSFAVRELGADG